MIDASKGFVKDGNKNRLRHQDLHKIVDVFNKQTEVPKYARMVPVAEIEANDYNLNIPRYIDSAEAEDLHDIAAHLLGGIPNRDINALEVYWQVFPTLKQELFAEGPRPGYSSLRVETEHVKVAIYTHPEFTAYNEAVAEWYLQWQTSNMPGLKSLDVGSSPKQLIEMLSEDMLRVFAQVRLIDKYDVYQRLMNYWSDTMQDDVYIIALDGWKANSDLIPQQLIIQRYFAADQQNIEILEATREAITRKMEELDDEHGGEGGVLEEAKNEKGKITKVNVKARLRDIFDDPDTEEEQSILNAYLSLLEQETEAKKKVREAQEESDTKIAAKYKTLNEDEVKTLVVDDKWLNTLMYDIQNELNRISLTLTGRIKELAERYATPLPRLTEEVGILSARVDEHLKEMGLVW